MMMVTSVKAIFSMEKKMTKNEDCLVGMEYIQEASWIESPMGTANTSGAKVTNTIHAFFYIFYKTISHMREIGRKEFQMGTNY